MKTRRIVRFSVPVLVTVATVGVSSLSHLGTASADIPNLPSLTPAEVLAKVSSAKIPAFTGSVRLKANLGLPDLGGFGGSIPSTAVGLLTGEHAAQIASDGADGDRITLAADAAEQVWVKNATDAWAWNSQTQTASHVAVGQGAGRVKDARGKDDKEANGKTDPNSAPEGADATGKNATDATDATDANDAADLNGGKANASDAMNPATFAKDLLAKVDPSTNVSTTNAAMVAGRAAYELVLSPKSAVSTVSEIVIAVDAATGIPLEARITAKGGTAPALSLGFTSLSLSTPSAATFTFVPPTGSTKREVSALSDLLPIANQRRHHRDDAPKNGAANPTASDTTQTGDTAKAKADNANASMTVGTAWESVVILNNASSMPQLNSLLANAKTVTLNGGGTAKLLTTTLINAMIASDGRIAIGAVNAAGLQSALNASPVVAPVVAATPAT